MVEMKERAVVAWLKAQRENKWPDAFKAIFLHGFREGTLCGHEMASATSNKVIQEFFKKGSAQ